MTNRYFKFKLALVCFCVIFIPGLQKQTLARMATVVINEFLAANDTTIADMFGKYSDWLELYNSSGNSFNLQGYTLTDDLSEPQKWSLPGITIAPGSFLLIWASGENYSGPGELHTNFKLDKNGEQIGLFDPDGQVVDSITFAPQKTDISYGRFPDGNGWSYPLFPTPALANQLDLQSPVFSIDQGFYPTPVILRLSAPGATLVIRYTLDGSDVSNSCKVATGPIRIDTTTVVRAACFAANGKHSASITKIYFINETSSLPILSLVTDPQNLWHPDSGIFTNFDERGDNWERPVSTTLFENGTPSGFECAAGLRIHGYASRHYPKKSVRLYFRSEYGCNWLNYPVFPDYPVQDFKRLVIHASGEDQLFYPGRWTLLKNALVTTISKNTSAIATASRPVLVFLNGTFWGIYHLRERIDDNFVTSHFGYNEMDLLKGNTTVDLDVENGTLDNWQETYHFFTGNEFSRPRNFQIAASLIDIDNFIDYMIIGAYSGDHDWPHNNFYMVRQFNDDSRWRWIFWDSDHAFANHHRESVALNSIEWITRDHPMPELKLFGSEDKEKYIWGTLVLRRLLENKSFKNNFLNRFADLLNTGLSPEVVLATVDSLAAAIEPDISREIEKWGKYAHPDALTDWNDNIAFMRDYITRRPGILFNYLVSKFNLAGLAKLTIAPAQGDGHVLVNTIQPPLLPWQGTYFKDIQIGLKAIPGPNHIFIRWDDMMVSPNDFIKINLKNDYSVAAIFADRRNPVVSVTPLRYNFGNTRLHTIAKTKFWIRNPGMQTLIVHNMKITGRDSSEFNLLHLHHSFSLNPGDSVQIIVQFIPITAGNKSAELAIISNDPIAKVLNLKLAGRCVDGKYLLQEFDLEVPNAIELENYRDHEENLLGGNQETLEANDAVNFTDITASSNTRGYSANGYGHGVSFADVDQDGRVDLFVSNAIRDESLPDLLYMNQGNNSFTEEAGERGVDDPGLTHSIVTADIDNDGDLDAFFANMPENDTSPIGRNALYRNDGNGYFTDITDWAGIANENNGTRGAIALDVDNDGDLDLYAVNWGESNEMYINNGSGKMTREDRGANGPSEDPDEFGQQGVTAADVDNDGDLDIYVSRRQEGSQAAPNWLFINDGTGHFVERAASRGVDVGGRTNGATFADVDNDGDLDLFVVNYAYTSGDLPKLGVFFNRGDGFFDDRTDQYDIYVSGYSVVFADADNDADLDLYLIRNDQKDAGTRPELYLNDGTGNFARESGTGLEVAAADSRAAGSADIDNDGDIDFYITCKNGYNFMLRNDTETANHYIDILCIGPGGDYGGFGSRVSVFQAGHSGDPDHLLGYQQVVSNYGYLCQDQTALHFGLGHHTTCDIRIIQTDGTVVDYHNVAADQFFQMGMENYYNISGTVNYYYEDRPVAESIIDLTHAAGDDQETTDSNGSYRFPSVISGNVTLVPGKEDDLRDAITGSDALLVLQYLAFITNMTPEQQVAAEVTEDGEVTGSDAQAILRYLAFFTDYTGSTGQWRFDPADSSFTLQADATVNFKAFLSGDANGSWGSGSAALANSSTKSNEPVHSSACLSIAWLANTIQDQLEFAVIVSCQNEKVHTLVFSLAYDPALLRYCATEKTALSNDFMMVTNDTEPGKLHFAMADVNGITNSGELLRLVFEPINRAELQKYDIKFNRALVNDKLAVSEDGNFCMLNDNKSGIPENYNLFQNYPNPFSLEARGNDMGSSTTIISYQLPEADRVSIVIYNINGKQIRKFDIAHSLPGQYHVDWDGMDESGHKVATGVYFYQLTAGKYNAIKKLTVIK